MRALSRNSKWTSKIYSQEVGEGNWALASPQIEARHPRIILDSESSATELVSYQNLDVQPGDKLLVKLSDGEYHEVTAESVAKNNPTGGIEITRQIDDNTYWTVTGEQAINFNYPGQRIFSNDGTKLWSNATGTGLIQYNLSTPFDVTTMTSSGVNLSALDQGTNNHGWFFADNGRYIFMGTTLYRMHRYTLSTRYDISTAYNLVTHTWNSGFTFSEWTTGAISEDGLTMMLFEPNGGYSKYTMQTPFEVTSMSIVDYGTVSLVSNQTTYTYAHITPNGKYMMTYYDDVAAGPYIKLITFSPPFDVTSPSETILSTSTFGGLLGSTSNNGYSRAIFSEDLRHMTLLGGYSNSYNRLVDVYTRLNIPTRIDISTAGLTEVPSEVILINDLKANISFANDASRVSSITEQLWLENSTVTTSSAVVGHIESNKLEVGDTIILNGSDEVVLTGVTETLDGLPYISLDVTDGNKLLNIANVGYGGDPTTLDVHQGPSPKMTFSPDGKKLFVAFNSESSGELYKHGIACYNLEIPWDTTTMSPDARGVIPPTQFGFASVYIDMRQTYEKFLGIQFSDDGTRMFTFFSIGVVDIRITQSELMVPWDPYTISSTWASPDITNSTYSSLRNVDIYIDQGGTSLVILFLTTSTSSSNLANRVALSISAWDVTSLTGDWTASSANFNFTRNETADVTTASYRGAFERFNSDKSIIIFCGSGGTSDGFGTGSMKVVKDDPSVLLGTSFPAGITLDGDPDAVITDAYLSDDGTKFFVLTIAGALYEYQIRAETLQKYEITFAAQTVAPTSIHVKERTIPVTLTPTLVSLNAGDADITWSSDPIEIDSRALQIQVDGAGPSTEISTIRLDLFTEL